VKSVLYEKKTSLVYDKDLERYVPEKLNFNNNGRLDHNLVLPVLKAAFLPEGVTKSYYRYVAWQSVLGTQNRSCWDWESRIMVLLERV
jgi:hypothetical protein